MDFAKELRDEANSSYERESSEQFNRLLLDAADKIEDSERILKIRALDNKNLTDIIINLENQLEALKSKAIFLDFQTIKELSKYTQCYAPLLRGVAIACQEKLNNNENN